MLRSRALVLALLAGLGCNETMTQLPGADEDEDLEEPAWEATPLVVSALAVGGTPGIDTTFTRGAMTAVLSVDNGNGAEVGRMDVTVFYEFTEISDSVERIATGVYRLGDPEIRKVSRIGSATVTVDPGGEGSTEVDLGTPRPLTQMSASRSFHLTRVSVTAIRLHSVDTLNAASLIRIATNERHETRLADFGHLGIVYAGLVLPSLVPGDVRLEGGTLTGTSTHAGDRETVWDFEKSQGAGARIVFDVRNQAPFTVPAGVPWVVSHDRSEPLVVETDTIWPQVTLVQGSTTVALAPGETITIDTGFTTDFAQDPPNRPEYVVLVDTESVSRIYPIILAGEPVRAWLNVTDRAARGR